MQKFLFKCLACELVATKWVERYGIRKSAIENTKEQELLDGSANYFKSKSSPQTTCLMSANRKPWQQA